MRVVILTGYSSIATAVEAIKRGACNYLCSAGDHILVSRSVFGSTISLFEKYFKRFGVNQDARVT